MDEKSGSTWRLKRVFRSFGKFLLIFLCFIITILLLSVVLMQFKSVRHFALNKVLNTVTSKTNSVITADDLHFYFTGYVKLEGLYVEDLNSDDSDPETLPDDEQLISESPKKTPKESPAHRRSIMETSALSSAIDDDEKNLKIEEMKQDPNASEAKEYVIMNRQIEV